MPTSYAYAAAARVGGHDSVGRSDISAVRPDIVRAWIELHRDELEANWERAVRYEKPNPIEPLR